MASNENFHRNIPRRMYRSMLLLVFFLVGLPILLFFRFWNSLTWTSCDDGYFRSYVDQFWQAGTTSRTMRGTMLGRLYFRGVVVPKIVHSIWMANPLKPFVIAHIDSVFHFMPDVTYMLHIIPPGGCNATVLAALRRQFDLQIQPLVNGGSDIQIVMHHDIPSEFRGTPLENQVITQENMGGLLDLLVDREDEGNDRYGSPHGSQTHGVLHAASILRYLIVYKYGGIYLDTDVVVLRDMWEIVNMLGAFLPCEDDMDAHSDGSGLVVNAILAGPPGHPYFKDCLRQLSKSMSQHSVNDIVPVPGTKTKLVVFGITGALCMTKVKDEWIQQGKEVWIAPPCFPDAVYLHQLSGPTDSRFNESITIIGRRYFMPTSYADSTLTKPLTHAHAKTYKKAYSFHMWEQGTILKSLARENFLEVVRDSPNSVLAYLFKKTCSLICNPDDLYRPVDSLSDLIKAVSPNAKDMRQR